MEDHFPFNHLVSPTPQRCDNSDPISQLSSAAAICQALVMASRLPSPAPSGEIEPSQAYPHTNSKYLHPLPPSPIASPSPPIENEHSKLTLCSLPPEVLLNILYQLSLPETPIRECWDKYYKARVSRNLPLLSKDDKRSLSLTSRGLREFVTRFAAYDSLSINDISGLRHITRIANWTPEKFQPSWAFAKNISLRWCDGGRLELDPHTAHEVWEILKERAVGKKRAADFEYVEEAGSDNSNHGPRADQVNMTGEKPKNADTYFQICRQYLAKSAVPKSAKPPQTTHEEDLYAILSMAQDLEQLTLDFPGAIKSFINIIIKLSEDKKNRYPILSTLKTLKLRNGRVVLFPPPPDLFVAISKLTALEELKINGECGGQYGHFPTKKIKRRKNAFKYKSLKDTTFVSSDWNWECEPFVDPGFYPKNLRKCRIEKVAGLRNGEGVWEGEGWPFMVGEKGWRLAVDSRTAMEVVTTVQHSYEESTEGFYLGYESKWCPRARPAWMEVYSW